MEVRKNQNLGFGNVIANFNVKQARDLTREKHGGLIKLINALSNQIDYKTYDSLILGFRNYPNGRIIVLKNLKTDSIHINFQHKNPKKELRFLDVMKDWAVKLKGDSVKQIKNSKKADQEWNKIFYTEAKLNTQSRKLYQPKNVFNFIKNIWEIFRIKKGTLSANTNLS